MADEIKINRPVTPQPTVSPAASVEAKPQGSSKLPWIVLVVVVVVIAAAAFLFRDKLFPSKDGAVKGASTKSSGYQAVFLTNGQVYFGKISNTNDNYVTLADIYYLQVTQPPLQGSQPASSTPEASPQISLVKLGSELHGPVDEMHINRQQVLFYEDLKTEGQVVKAIQDYKATPSK